MSFEAKFEDTFGINGNGGGGSANYNKQACGTDLFCVCRVFFCFGFPFDINCPPSLTRYSELQTNADFFAVGGHECSRDYKQWLKTVPQHPAPISTKLGLLSDLIHPKCVTESKISF